jgi:SAM-dependent methyltransferase
VSNDDDDDAIVVVTESTGRICDALIAWRWQILIRDTEVPPTQHCTAIPHNGARDRLRVQCHCYDALMRLRDAIDMLSDSGIEALGPTSWADLGCGDGTFTLALAELLASGSSIHAMDRDGSALGKIPSAHKGVHITTHRGDFTHESWPFAGLDGVLMANSLHYVAKQGAFIRACEQQMNSRHCFLIVEYDTTEASRWLPYPVSQTKLTDLFERAGYSSIRVMRVRPSVYRRASLYAAAIGPS